MPDVAGSTSKEIPHDTDDDVNIESEYHFDDDNNAESAYYSNSADNQNNVVYESVIYNDAVLDDDDDDDDDDGESVHHQQSENTGNKNEVETVLEGSDQDDHGDNDDADGVNGEDIEGDTSKEDDEESMEGHATKPSITEEQIVRLTAETYMKLKIECLAQVVKFPFSAPKCAGKLFPGRKSQEVLAGLREDLQRAESTFINKEAELMNEDELKAEMELIEDVLNKDLNQASEKIDDDDDDDDDGDTIG
nr:protein PFC0760c-like [Lytechinus pictus]